MIQRNNKTKSKIVRLIKIINRRLKNRDYALFMASLLVILLIIYYVPINNQSSRNTKIIGRAVNSHVTSTVTIIPSNLKNIITGNYNSKNNIVGRIIYNNSFNININYNYYKRWQDLYNIVKNVIETCKNKGKNIKDCVNEKIKKLTGEKGFKIIQSKPDPLYDFIDYYTQCSESKDNDCVCDFNLSKIKASTNIINLMFYYNQRATYFSRAENELFNSTHYDFPKIIDLNTRDIISGAQNKKLSALVKGKWKNQPNGVSISLLSLTPTKGDDGYYKGFKVDKKYIVYVNQEGTLKQDLIYKLIYSPDNNENKQNNAQQNLFLFYKLNNKIYLTKKYESKTSDYAHILFNQLKKDIKDSCTATADAKYSFCSALMFCNFLSNNNYLNNGDFTTLCNEKIKKCDLGTCTKRYDSDGKYIFTKFNGFSDDMIKNVIKKYIESYINEHQNNKVITNNAFEVFVYALNNLPKKKCTLIKHRFQFLIKDTSLKKPLLYYDHQLNKYQLRYPVFNIAFYVP